MRCKPCQALFAEDSFFLVGKDFLVSYQSTVPQKFLHLSLAFARLRRASRRPSHTPTRSRAAARSKNSIVSFWNYDELTDWDSVPNRARAAPTAPPGIALA